VRNFRESQFSGFQLISQLASDLLTALMNGPPLSLRSNELSLSHFIALCGDVMQASGFSIGGMNRCQNEERRLHKEGVIWPKPSS
jgi:hypothetical protein